MATYMDVDDFARSLEVIVEDIASYPELEEVEGDLQSLAESIEGSKTVSMEIKKHVVSLLDLLRDELPEDADVHNRIDDLYGDVQRSIETTYRLHDIGEKTKSSTLSLGSQTVRVTTRFNPYTQYKKHRISESLATWIIQEDLIDPVLNKTHDALRDIIKATTFLLTHPSTTIQCEILIEEDVSGLLFHSSTDDLVNLGLKLSAETIYRMENEDKPLSNEQYRTLVHELTHHFDDVYRRDQAEQGVLGYLQLLRDEALSTFAEKALSERGFLKTIDSAEQTLEKNESNLPKALGRYSRNYRKGSYQLAEATSHLLYQHYLQQGDRDDDEDTRKQFIKKLRLYDVHQYWEAYKEARKDLGLDEDKLCDLHNAYQALE